MGYTVKKYEDEDSLMWDAFVENDAINGSFLQTRRFLNYHPKDRFTDFSCLVFGPKGHLVAVCPACEKVQGDKILVSHAGSTYGGVIIHKKYFKINKVIEILNCLEEFWKENNFKQLIIKQTPNILSKEKNDLFQYAFKYNRFSDFYELNLYVDFEQYSENILSEIAQGKRTNVNNCQKRGLYCKKLTTFEEIVQLHNLLSITLMKYNRTPIHTAREIYEFQTDRLKKECQCFGIYENDKMIAASMMFYFHSVKVAHTQYLCADPEYNKLSPMTFMYYSMLKEMRKEGFNKVSWGIVTEDMGRELNEGLARSKEDFGSKYEINPIYVKVLEE